LSIAALVNTIRAAALVVAMLLVFACSGSGGGGSPVATNTVNLPPSYKFVPADVSVAAGTTVTWTNNDNFTHSVEFTDGGLPTQPMQMNPGQAVTFKFSNAGTFHYRCSFHPQNMKGSVVVGP
jgi:plastocyanin